MMLLLFVSALLQLSAAETGTWTQLPNAAWSPRGGLQMVTSQGSVLVAGGTSDPGTSFNDAYRFQQGKWTELPSSSTQWRVRSDFAMSSFSNGTVVLCGGQNEVGGVASLNDVWKLEAGTDNWNQLASAPWEHRLGHSVSTCSGGAGSSERMILTGGVSTRTGIFMKQYNDVWAMDANGAWTQLKQPPWQKRWLHRTVCRSDGQLILTGGHSGFRDLNDVWVMSRDESWSELSPAAPFSTRAEFGMVRFADDSVLIGSTDGAREDDGDFWLLKSDMKTWSKVAKAPFSSRKAYGMAAAPNGKRSALIAGGTILYNGIHNWNEVWQIDLSNDTANFVLV